MKKILTATIISLFILIHYTTSVFADCDGWAKSGETHRNAGNGCQYTCNGSSWSGPKNCDGQGNGQFQGEKAKTEEEKKKQAEAVEQRNKEAEQKVKEQGEKKTQENAAATAQQRANEAARQQAMLESQRQAEVERAKAQGATPQQIAQITEQYRQRSQQISQAQGTTNGQDIVGSDNPNATQFARDGYLATSANATGHVNLPAASATQSEIQRVQAALDAILKAELNGCPESVCGIQRARLEAQLQQLRNSANAATRSEANSYYNTYNSIRQTQAQIDALYAERTQLVSNIIRSGSHSAPSAQTTLRLQQIDKQIATLNKDAQGFQQELQGYSALQSRNSITQSQQQLRLEQERIAREEAARRNQVGNNPQPSRQPVYNDPGNDTPSIPRTPRPAASTSPRVTTTPEIPEYAPGTTTNAVPSQSQTIRQSDQAIITTQMNTATQITNNIVRLFRLQAEADAAGNSARAKELADQIAQQWGQLDNIYQKESGLSPSGQQMLRNRLTGLANSTNAQINLIENKVNASAAAYQENVSSNRNTLPGILGQVSNTVQRALCTSRGNRWSDNVGCVAMTTNTSNEVQVTPAEVTGLQGLLNNSAGSFQAAQLGITEPELNTIRDRVNEGQSIQNQLYVLEVKITGAESRGDQALADQLRREQAILLQDITDLTVNTGLSQTGQQQLQSYLLEQMQENTNRRTALQGRVGSLQNATPTSAPTVNQTDRTLDNLISRYGADGMSDVQTQAHRGRNILDQVYLLEQQATRNPNLAEENRLRAAALVGQISDLTNHESLSDDEKETLTNILLGMGQVQERRMNELSRTTPPVNSESLLLVSDPNWRPSNTVESRLGYEVDNRNLPSNSPAAGAIPATGHPDFSTPSSLSDDPQNLLERLPYLYCTARGQIWLRAKGCVDYQEGENDTPMPRGIPGLPSIADPLTAEEERERCLDQNKIWIKSRGCVEYQENVNDTPEITRTIPTLTDAERCRQQNKVWINGRGCIEYSEPANDTPTVPQGIVSVPARIICLLQQKVWNDTAGCISPNSTSVETTSAAANNLALETTTLTGEQIALGCYSAAQINTGCDCVRRRLSSNQCSQEPPLVNVSPEACGGKFDYFDRNCLNKPAPTPIPPISQVSADLLPTGAQCSTDRICQSRVCGTNNRCSAAPTDSNQISRNNIVTGWYYGAFGGGNSQGWGSLGVGINSIPRTPAQVADTFVELCNTRTVITEGQQRQCHADLVIYYPGHFVSSSVDVAEEIIARGGTVSFDIRVDPFMTPEQVIQYVLEPIWSGTSPYVPAKFLEDNNIALSLDIELPVLRDAPGYSSAPTGQTHPYTAEDINMIKDAFDELQRQNGHTNSTVYVYEVGILPTMVSNPEDLDDNIIPIHAGFVAGTNDQTILDLKVQAIENMNDAYNTDISGCMVYDHRMLQENERDGFDREHADEYLARCQIQALQ